MVESMRTNSILDYGVKKSLQAKQRERALKAKREAAERLKKELADERERFQNDLSHYLEDYLKLLKDAGVKPVDLWERDDATLNGKPTITFRKTDKVFQSSTAHGLAHFLVGADGTAFDFFHVKRTDLPANTVFFDDFGGEELEEVEGPTDFFIKTGLSSRFFEVSKSIESLPELRKAHGKAKTIILESLWSGYREALQNS